MKYSNPKIVEGINSGGNRPVRDFFVLGGGTLAAIFVATYVLFQAMDVLGAYIPFKWEKTIAGPFVEAFTGREKGDPAAGDRLKNIAGRLAGAMDLPEGMDITVFFLKDKKVNAFATLGGNIFVFAGLATRMPSENALAMVIAHEIAHVKNRDVIRGVSAGIMFSLVASVVFGDLGWAEDIISGEGLLTTLHFSRKHERAADEQALAALVKVYGHAGGFADLFRMLRHAGKDQKRPPAILSTHPRIENRIANLKKLAEQKGWPITGPLSPLRLSSAGAR